MIAKKPPTSLPIIIDLDGASGNAFSLAAIAQDLAVQIGLDGDAIFQEMLASTYEQVVKTFDQYFGTFVRLETSDESLLKALQVDV